MMQGQKNIKKT